MKTASVKPLSVSMENMTPEEAESLRAIFCTTMER